MNVVAVDTFTPYYSVGIKRARAELLLSQLGVSVLDLDPRVLLQRDTSYDVIFHLAGQPGVRASWGAAFSGYVDANINLTNELLGLCAGKVPRFVMASSSSIYGDQAVYPVVESALPAPISPYGVTKLAAEGLLRSHAVAHGLETAALRYFTVYGAWQRPDMAFTRFCYAALTGGSIRINGNGEQAREFTHVSDIAAATALAGLQPLPSRVNTFNLAGGSVATINDALTLISEKSGRALDVSYNDVLAGDVQRTDASTAYAQEVLNWAPRTGLSEGVADQLAWVRENLSLIGGSI